MNRVVKGKVAQRFALMRVGIVETRVVKGGTLVDRIGLVLKLGRIRLNEADCCVSFIAMYFFFFCYSLPPSLLSHPFDNLFTFTWMSEFYFFFYFLDLIYTMKELKFSCNFLNFILTFRHEFVFKKNL